MPFVENEEIMPATPSVFIAAIASDIGRELARLYRRRGFSVVGTYRTSSSLGQLNDDGGITLLPCDVSDPASIAATASAIGAMDRPWETFIGAVGQLDPIGAFFECDNTNWTQSVAANSLGQLSLLHAIYPFRDQTRPPTKIAFLVGGGLNGPFRNYSAYCLGKVMLVKFCELIDDEYPDVHAIAIGTGWVNTKIHRQTLNAPAAAGDNYRRTYEFVSSGGEGTSIEDILGCMDWCFAAGRNVSGGRNFSVVHDAWRAGGAPFAAALAANRNTFKLRREGSNDAALRQLDLSRDQ